MKKILNFDNFINENNGKGFDQIMKHYGRLKPLTISEILNMSTNEHKQIKSICWKYDEVQYNTVGIYNFNIKRIGYLGRPESIKVTWSDGGSDPTIYLSSEVEPIDKINMDEYDYGLYW